MRLPQPHEGITLKRLLSQHLTTQPASQGFGSKVWSQAIDPRPFYQPQLKNQGPLTSRMTFDFRLLSETLSFHMSMLHQSAHHPRTPREVLGPRLECAECPQSGFIPFPLKMRLPQPHEGITLKRLLCKHLTTQPASQGFGT